MRGIVRLAHHIKICTVKTFNILLIRTQMLVGGVGGGGE